MNTYIIQYRTGHLWRNYCGDDGTPIELVWPSAAIKIISDIRQVYPTIEEWRIVSSSGVRYNDKGQLLSPQPA